MTIKAHKTKTRGEKYIQCDLKNINGEQTAYIPEKYAKEGLKIRIKQSDRWQNWVVHKVYRNTLSDISQVDEIRHARKKHRTVSDKLRNRKAPEGA